MFAPTVVEYLPAPQLVQPVEPTLSAYLPAAQVSQSSLSPIAPLEVPGWQEIQKPRLESYILPAGHLHAAESKTNVVLQTQSLGSSEPGPPVVKWAPQLRRAKRGAFLMKQEQNELSESN